MQPTALPKLIVVNDSPGNRLLSALCKPALHSFKLASFKVFIIVAAASNEEEFSLGFFKGFNKQTKKCLTAILLKTLVTVWH